MCVMLDNALLSKF